MSNETLPKPSPRSRPGADTQMTNNQMMTKEGVSIDCNSDQKTTSHNNVNNIAAAIHMPFVHNAAIHVSGIENE